MLLAVEPALYETALSFLLEEADVDDVISFAERDGDVSGRYDVAVVSTGLPPQVDSDVVIYLPDTDSGAGELRVETAKGSRTIRIEGPREIFEVIDLTIPGPRSRVDVF